MDGYLVVHAYEYGWMHIDISRPYMLLASGLAAMLNPTSAIT
jgi:hypothetical protein